MSEIERVKVELHQMSSSAKAAASSLGGFKLQFSQQSAQVQALIAGTATSTDKAIAQVLDAADKAVDAAIDALSTAAHNCASYADQI